MSKVFSLNARKNISPVLDTTAKTEFEGEKRKCLMPSLWTFKALMSRIVLYVIWVKRTTPLAKPITATFCPAKAKDVA